MSFGYGQESQQSESSSDQSVWGGQSPFLSSLYQSAQDMFNSQSGQVRPAAGRFANEGLAGARAGMGSMQDIARTGGPVGQYAQPNNALAKQQLSEMSRNIATDFRRDVLPSLNSAAGVAGGMGGSRNAIGRGLAASDAQRQIAQAGTDLYSNQYQIGAQSAGAATQARLAAAGELPGMGSSLYNLGMSPFTASWAPMTALSAMLGGPVTLNKMRSTGSGSKTSGSFGLFG